MTQKTLQTYSPIEQWKGRERLCDGNGYIIVKVPEHPRSFRSGWYYEHRLVAEKMLGRLLKTYETVHHINENKLENTEDNLFVCTRKEHDRAHLLTA